MTEHVSLTRYEAARTALAEAVRVDEVQAVRNIGLQMRAYAKIAKDKRVQADAATLIVRAERKLGVLIQSRKEMGELGKGRPSRSNVAGKAEQAEENSSGQEQFSGGEDEAPFTLAEAGIDRKLSMRAQNWARLGENEFEAKLQEVRDKIESSGATVVNPQKDLSTSDKKKRRAEREAELAARQRALPDKRYGVILADPEWAFEPFSRETGLDRAADNHYPTSPLEVIKARPVGDIAAADCVLFLWATVPMLPQALEVMAAWGFGYKSHVVWHKKDALGTGYWFRNCHELLLVGTRGQVPAPAPGTQWPSILSEAPGEHSAKPEFSIKLIEEYFPRLPRIELNARAARPGWDSWGNEAPEESRSESNDAIPPGGPANLTGGDAPSLAGQSLSDFRREAIDTVVDALGEVLTVAAGLGGPAAAGGGEGNGQEPVPAELPHAGIATAELSSEQKNDIIRAGYARNTPVPVLAERTGLSRDSVKQRARTMKLGSRARQKAMASAFTTEQNRRRAR